MGRKIFVSYKYGDYNVAQLERKYWAKDKHGDFDQTVKNAKCYKPNDGTTVRAYVNKLEEIIGKDNNIFKGEKDGESLADFKDKTIERGLKEKIYDSTVTIVLISPNMKDGSIPEEDQWIPWEISYSLREKKINDRTSRRNAILAVVLPDRNDSYDYYIKYNYHSCTTITLNTEFLFNILRENMFNIKNIEAYSNKCEICDPNHNYYKYDDNVSYIYSVTWKDFIKNIEKYIKDAVYRCEEQNKYDLKINLNENR